MKLTETFIVIFFRGSIDMNDLIIILLVYYIYEFLWLLPMYFINKLFGFKFLCELLLIQFIIKSPILTIFHYYKWDFKGIYYVYVSIIFLAISALLVYLKRRMLNE